MHRKEVTHSNGSYERKSHGRKLADEIGRTKKFPWYTHGLMRRGRVTSELRDSYFRLMTIKHSISKIEWASNDYITQLSSTASWVAASWSRDVVGKATPGRRGLGPWWVWGPEKMLIRCSKESQHPAEWTPASREQERHNVTAIRVEVKILKFLFGLQLPLTVKLHTPFLNPCNKARGKNILLKKSSCVRLYHCVCFIIVSLWCCRWVYNII